MANAFDALNLSPELLEACRRQGFKAPTPIQALVVPVVARGRDAVVEAKTGSGKTLAYGLPLLDRAPLQDAQPETLVIVPTRELAQQVEHDLTKSAGTLPRPVVTLVGRGGLDRQKEKLDAGCNIVVGTPGRIEEALARGVLRLDRIRTVVLDEVDELLKGGFSRNLALLLGQVPRDRQTLLFSATIPTEVEAVAKKFTRDAARLRLATTRDLPEELTHQVLHTSVRDRIPDLVAYLRATRPFQAVIFCGTRHETEEVHEAVSELGIDSEYLHGELSPNKRRQLIERVRSGDLPVLIASDLAARGLDLPGVDAVLNYSLPKGTAAYLHRAGRTGRAGRPGVVVSLLIEQQHELFEKLQATFTFQAVEVFKSGRLVKRTVKSREERDLQFRKRPEKPVGAARTAPAKPRPAEPARSPSVKPGKRPARDASPSAARPAKAAPRRPGGPGGRTASARKPTRRPGR